MSTELARRSDLNALTLEELKDIGGMFAKSGYFKDARDAAQAIVKILYGKELGFSPVTSMMGIHIVEGKPELSANMLASLVKSSERYDYRVRQSTDEACEIVFMEGDEEIGLSSFTIGDAERAGLVRPGGRWKKYPKAMLFARAMSQGVRTHCPDVAMGCPIYATGEISGEPQPVSEPTTVTMKVQRTPEPTPQPEKAPEPPQDAAQTLDLAKAEADASLPNPEDLITSGQMSALARNWNGVCEGNGIEREKSEDLRHAYLKAQGYVDSTGQGTSKAIPKARFEGARDAALLFAGRVNPDNYEKAMAALVEKARERGAA